MKMEKVDEIIHSMMCQWSARKIILKRSMLSVSDTDEECKDYDNIVEECENVEDKGFNIQLKSQREFAVFLTILCV